MSVWFPFDLPGPSALYVTFYIVTLAIHVAFMNYVLAGSAYVAIATALARGRSQDDILVRILRDWLPFALGCAITAGVAPLLFVQVLYKENFYTANLLLFHRWMAMIPVLIAGFYLLYLGKSKALETWGHRAASATAVAAFACFAVTAYSFTENHLLAVDRTEWVAMYASGQMFYLRAAVFLRALLWITGSLPIMAVTLAWQLRRSNDDASQATRRLAVIAMTGLVASVAFALLYAMASEQAAHAQSLARSAPGHQAIIAAALLAQFIVWAWAWHTCHLDRRMLLIASLAALVTVFAVALVREALRLSALTSDALFELHARAAETGGLAAFLIFFVINAAVIATCLRITQQGLRKND